MTPPCDCGATAAPSPIPPPVAPATVLPLFLAALRKHRRVTFALADDLNGKHGMVNLAIALVLLDGRNTEGEMRATIAHELQHLVAPGATEDEVEAATARRLVPLDSALAAAEAGDFARVAAVLRVDEALVRARLRVAERPGSEQVAG